jgi:hypothetical protein
MNQTKKYYPITNIKVEFVASWFSDFTIHKEVGEQISKDM